MKKPCQAYSRFSRVWLLATLVMGGLWANSGQCQQYNRISTVMTVGECYTPQAAAQLGSAADLEVDMNNAVAWANGAMQNSGTGIWVENVGYHETTEADPGSLHTLLGEFYTWPDVSSFWSSCGSGIIQCVGIGTDDAGLSYEGGSEGTMSAVYFSYNVFAHELGRNNDCEQGDGFGGGGLVTIMLFNYCSGNNLQYFSNPGTYYGGYQLLGATSEDCGEGPLANEGNNARQFTYYGPGYQGSIPVPVSSLTVNNPLLTAVHCGGAAVSTLAADQRSFAADQNYSGGTAWDANGYNYTVDLSGVTNPAPQVLYQDQRYGNMTYTFTNYLPGTNYLVRLHCMECCWSARGQREFNVFINGQQVLTNFDIFATAGAQNRAVIKEIMTTANSSGDIVIQFVNVVDNASISGIEILQGGLYVPINLTASADNGQVSLGWSPVTGATSYNVKRATVSGGPYTTITNIPSPSCLDTNVTEGTTYYYVVSALNGGDESFNSLEVNATPSATTVDTWQGGISTDWNTAGNWLSGVPNAVDAYINSASGNICTLNATPATFPVDIVLGDGGGYGGRVDHRAGYLQTGSTNATGNWLSVGRGAAGTGGVYNLANTASSGSGLTGFAEGSGSLAAGKIMVGGAFYSDNGNGLMRINTTGSVISHSTQYYAASMMAGCGAYGIGEIDLENGTVTSGSSLWVGDSDGIGSYGGSGTFKINGGTLGVDADDTGNPSYLGYLNGSGTMIVSNGAVSFEDELRVGGSDTSGPGYNATGTLTIDGGQVNAGAVTIARGNNNQNDCSGTVTVNAGTLTCTNDLYVCYAGLGSGYLNIAGGTVNIGPTAAKWLHIGTYDYTRGQINLSSGDLNLDNDSSIKFSDGIYDTTYTTNSITQSGGTIAFYSDAGRTVGGTGNLDMQYGSGSLINNTYNLNGGTLIVPQIVCSAATVGMDFFNFNGGTLRLTAASTNSMQGLTAANVMVGGANIDTTNVNVTITPSLLNGDDLGGGLTKQGAGKLTLPGTNTYTGNTTIGNGTLALTGGGSLASSGIIVSNGATLDVSGTTSTYALNSGQSLFGSGTVNGALIAGSGSKIYAGPDGAYATNAFNGNLTFASGALAYMDMGTVHNGSNDLITVTGTLALNNTIIHLKAPAVGAVMDTGADYVLMTAGSLSGAPSATPVWDLAPASSTNFYVIIEGNSVALHYSATGLTPPGGFGAAAPAIATRNENVLVSVTQTNGSTVVTNVILNASTIGGSSSLPLVAAGGNVFTNTVFVGAGVGLGGETLTATLTDANNLSGVVNVSLTFVATNQVWDGGSTVDNNWTSNPNWTSGSGPGYSGDSVTFAGGTRLTPTMNTNYSLTGLAFNNTAGSFSIGSANNSKLTLTGGGITNNSANPQIVNVPLVMAAPQTFSAAAGNLTLAQAITNAGNLVTMSGASNSLVSGAISGSAGLTKTGGGVAILAANNTYTGPTVVSAGTLNVSGTVSNTNLTTVASSAGDAVLVNGGTLSQEVLLVGNATGAVGAVYQTNGTVLTTNATGFDNASIGNIAGGFGYYDAVRGAFSSDGIAVGGENNTGSGFSGTGGNGIMDIAGGTVNDTGWFVMSRGLTNETGILDVFSGSLSFAGGGLVCNWGTNQTAIINVLGGSLTSTSEGIGLGSTGNTGILNLNGGQVAVNNVGGNFGGAFGQVNFNGGTLRAETSNTAFLAVNSAAVYSGGATINDGGFALGLNESLQAPAGNGVNGIASFTGGAGYIAPPIVTVVRGSGDTTGAGATAIAQIDSSTGGPTSGQVTNVLITCPGAGYTRTPTFTLSGGGPSTPATITGTAPSPNASGGFTKLGSGTVSHSGTDTYAGATTVSAGTLRLVSSGAPSPTPLLYLSFDDVSGNTVINQGSGGASMNGTLTGTATIVSGGINGGNALNIPSGAANAAYVLITNPVVAMTGTASWTIGMWVKTTTAGGVYAYQGSGGWSSGNMTFYLNEGSDSGYGTKAGGVSYAQGWEEGSTNINDGNWHFLVMTCNGSTKAMYVDGNVDTIQSSWASATGVGAQLWIGGSADTGDEDVGLGGLIDGVCVYNSALSQTQIRALYTNNPAGPSVLPTTTPVSVASGATLDVNGASQTIGSLSGPGGSSVILGDVTNASGTLTVGNASSMVFAGTVSGTGSLTKAGAGALTLSGVNTYSGTTTISNGTLFVNGSIGGKALTVTSGGTLGGSGTAGGVVTVQSGGTVSPGGSDGEIGTLALSNAPALNGVVLMKINRNNGSLLNDQIKLVSGTLNFGGTLTVTNIGAPLQAGDTFQIFSATAYNGGFAAVNLPSLGDSLYWTNTLAANGQIAVVSGVSLVATNISWSMDGTNLTLSWPADHTGWRLLMQTNHLSSGLSTNINDWTTVASSQTTNQLIIPLNALNPTEFYRLIYP